MRKIPYNPQNKQSVLQQIAAYNKIVIEDAIHGLDENGNYTDCFLIILEDTIPAEDMLAEADMKMLNLEYENILLKEGLST